MAHAMVIPIDVAYLARAMLRGGCDARGQSGKAG